jgi:hypothetical protein
MPGFLDVLGNVQAAPAGIAAVNLARNVMRGERPAENIISAMGAQAPAYERSLTPLGLYSKGEETAATLPQAKGTPEQYAAMLQRAGVKPTEMEGFAEAFAGRPNVTREEIAQHFRENMPVVEERVLGSKEPYDAKRLAELEKEYVALKQHPLDDPSFGEDKFNEFIKLLNIRDRSTTQSLYDAADRMIREGQRAQARGDRAMADRYFREHEMLSTRAEKLDLEGQGMANPPKYGEYTLPGGENYREVLLRAPVKEPEGLAAAEQKADDLIKKTVDAMNDWKRTSEELAPGSPETLEKYRVLSEIKKERDVAVEKLNRLEEEKRESIFQSSHWDDPNVLVHLRMSDRTGPNGEKILHVEEVQSDWGQKGKREGFGASVPVGPYVTSTQGWTDLALKRALKEAAEGGYDKLVWTPGAEQAKRYDLSKQIDRLQYHPNTQSLRAFKDGEQIIDKSGVAPEQVADFVGKDVAKNLLSEDALGKGPVPIHELRGQDLSVGGEGMKGYYDKIVPTQLQKILKRIDPQAKVGMTDIMLPPSGARGSNNPPIQAPGITITPQMRENILRGLPHMADGGEVESYPLRSHHDWEEAHDYEKTGGKLKYESPEKYLHEVKPLNMDHDDKKLIHHFKKQMKKGEKMDPVAIYPDGHPNGRHRAHAAEDLGIKKIPVVRWPEKKKGGGPVVDKALMVISRRRAPPGTPG